MENGIKGGIFTLHKFYIFLFNTYYSMLLLFQYSIEEYFYSTQMVIGIDIPFLYLILYTVPAYNTSK